ncbi:MAG: hypothetical protein EAY75_16340 [Bacteroidetes bacterium]|nr:MAG: hypothetical protein EAY75_16340 [Bacteroidota bacterium]
MQRGGVKCSRNIGLGSGSMLPIILQISFKNCRKPAEISTGFLTNCPLQLLFLKETVGPLNHIG